jgi:hypothetical protein
MERKKNEQLKKVDYQWDIQELKRRAQRIKREEERIKKEEEKLSKDLN